MKKVSVVYATKTKHSKKIADAAAAALGVTAQDVMNRSAIGETDLLFIVGGIYGGQSLPEMLDFVSGLSDQVKSAAIITSSASGKSGQDGVCSRLEDKGIPVAGEFHCSGNFLFFRMGHPNQAEVRDAVNFAVQLSGKES